MNKAFDALSDFERLFSVFSRDLSTARSLKSPNPDDTIETRSAIVGFSYHSKTEDWERNHFNYLQQRVNDAASLEGNNLCFFCTCLGYLLGLFQAGKISEVQFHLAEAQLPGFVLLKTGRL